MHFLHQVYAWFADGAHWSGSSGIPTLFLRQLELSALVIAAAVVVGGGAGLVLGHTGRGSLVAVNAANAFRAVPTLALLTLLAIYPPIGLRYNGLLCSFLALTVLAIPPILTNTYVGIREVDADVTDASRAMGLTGGQILGRVELPLALPFIMAGIRTAAIEVVATSTLAAEVFYSDLGTPIIAGLNSNDTVEAFCGALLVAVMAALAALGLGALLKWSTPPGTKVGRRAGSLLTSAPALDTAPLRSA
jgi:osmoprotectant transport system permease protein